MESTFVAVIKAIVYGIVEGITEWLPISSTGHLIIFNSFFGTSTMYGDSFWNYFLVFIQLGAILAVLVKFFKNLNPFGPGKSKHERKRIGDTWLKIIIGCLPAGIIGVVAEMLDLTSLMDNVIVVATTLLIYGILFIIVEKINLKKHAEFVTLKEMEFYSKNRQEFKYISVSNLDYKICLYIGIAQILALIPGTSRSGITIIAALLLGCDRTCSSEYSFYLSIPVMIGASLIKMISFIRSGIEIQTNEIIYLTVGLFAAFVTSIIVIKMLLKFIKSHTFICFGYYRIAIAIVIFALFGAGLVTY